MEYPLRRLVAGAQNVNHTSDEQELSDRWITPANVLTALRPLVFGPVTAGLLLRGKRGATIGMAVVAASDGEGNVARFIDKRWPHLHLGASKKGKQGDPIADSIAFLEVGGAALASPTVSKLGKAAIGIVFAQEIRKAVWAAKTTSDYRRATISPEHPKGQPLDLPIDPEGKLATAEKFLALGAAALTSETDRPIMRLACGAIALGFGIAGAKRGEAVRQMYDQQVSSELATLALPTSESL